MGLRCHFWIPVQERVPITSNLGGSLELLKIDLNMNAKPCEPRITNLLTALIVVSCLPVSLILATQHCTSTQRIGGQDQGDAWDTCSMASEVCTGACGGEIVPKGQECILGGTEKICDPPTTRKDLGVQKWDFNCWKPQSEICNCVHDWSQEPYSFLRPIRWQECN